MGSGMTYVQAGLAEKPLVALKCKDASEPRLSYQLESYLDNQNKNNNYMKSCLSDSVDQYIQYACEYGKMKSYDKQKLANVKSIFINAFCSDTLAINLAEKMNHLIAI